MKTLTIAGSILLALGLAGVIWGGVVMHQDRDSIDIGEMHIVVDKGEFPPLGIAGAIGAGVGAVMIGIGASAGRD